MIHVTWYVKNRVVLAQVAGDITLDHIHDLNYRLIELVDQGAAPVHIIVEMSEAGHTPTHLLKLREASHILGHAGVGWIIVVGLQNPFMNFLSSMLTQVGHMSRYRVFPTLDEGYRFLQTADERLIQT